ncbi:hypothetical protein PM082_004604 [Marasmius tenuissimus]|nr:hypothetical protein PM082_004604 [Marasmius tenuissimus]
MEKREDVAEGGDRFGDSACFLGGWSVQETWLEHVLLTPLRCLHPPEAGTEMSGTIGGPTEAPCACLRGMSV